jgi:hypothetical protein
VVSWITALKFLETLIGDTIQAFIAPDELRTPAEKACSHLLKCSLLKDGGVAFNAEDHLEKQGSNQLWKLKNSLTAKDAVFL